MTRHSYTNLSRDEVELAIEPWAESIFVPPGLTLTFTLEGPNGVFEISEDEAGPMVFVWADRVTCGEGDWAREWTLAGPYVGAAPPDGFQAICRIAFRA